MNTRAATVAVLLATSLMISVTGVFLSRAGASTVPAVVVAALTLAVARVVHTADAARS